MLKRILFGGGATGALVAAYFVGSLTLGGAFAQTAPTQSPAAKETSSQAESANEAAESAALAAKATISADQAKAAALAKFPGATVGKVELDNENGVIAYGIRLTDSAGAHQEMSVDATSGTVLQAQAEAAEAPGAAEGPETAD